MIFWREHVEGEEDAAWDLPQEHLANIKNEKGLSLCEIRNNPTPSLLFTRPPYKLVQEVIEFYDEFFR